MKYSELTSMKEAELHDKLAEMRKEYVESTRSHAAGELANPRVLTAQRRDIARVKTALKAQQSKGKDDGNA